MDSLVFLHRATDGLPRIRPLPLTLPQLLAYFSRLALPASFLHLIRFLFSSLPPHLLLLYALMLRLFVPSPSASCKCFSQPLEDTRVHKSNEHATPLICLSYGYSRVAFGWTNANVSVSHTQHEHCSGGCLVDSAEFRAQMVADKGKFVCYRPYARLSRMSFNWRLESLINTTPASFYFAPRDRFVLIAIASYVL